jgi:peroxin-1
MPSKRKLAPIISRDGLSGARGGIREQEVPLVEMDATFARTLGLSDGLKVTATLHFDPPLAHTVHIEPLTPADWEIIELHATFLELNLLSQIRALPNPTYTPATGPAPTPHPLTLHLSPTSTANIIITSLDPTPPSSLPYAKIAPDAEVIVAPKTRSKPARTSTRDSRSATSTSKKSIGARSGGSTVRAKGPQEDERPPVFLRALDKRLCDKWFEDDETESAQELTVWVDRDLLASKSLRGLSYVAVSIMRPAGIEPPVDPQKAQQEVEAAGEAGNPATKVVAKLAAWEDPPDSRHAALSPAFCTALGCDSIVGGIAKLEPPPSQASKHVERLKIYPFIAGSGKKSDGLRFGGESKAERDEAANRFMKAFGKQGDLAGLLDGPLTDGLVLGAPTDVTRFPGWTGGIVRYDPPISATEAGKQACTWVLGLERKLPIVVQAPIPRPGSHGVTTIGEALPDASPVLVGIDPLLAQLRMHLSHMSSVLLTGGLGSGKSSVTQSLAHYLRSSLLFHTVYYPCRKLITEETRIATIKEDFTRAFMDAAWGARLGGKAIVILDDLDKVCPAETELETTNNGRSRQVSETLCSIVRQYCSRDTGVVLLATAQAKESLHNLIIGGHVVRDIVSLKAPDKEGRRQVMEMVAKLNVVDASEAAERRDSVVSRPATADGSGAEDDGGWMDGADDFEKPSKAKAAQTTGFVLDRDVDFLDLAGQTDGYMPADLSFLVSRARSEAVIRHVAFSSTTTSKPSSTSSAHNSIIHLSQSDFQRALKGFTPASLRNVTLQTSTTTFSSIGGLQETRRVLLETLQYPTTYAPIFAQCPLRLRSGLLLYGYPGCGKTLLASAVAAECGLNFISVKGPEILNKYIGASEKSVRDLFERAEAARPCVLFFDEFDSIAPKRGHDSTGVTDRVVNQLLTQMDGAEGLSGVYVLAATSRPDLIDPALLRPGRLDKSLICDMPGLEDRVDILNALGKKLKLGTDVIDRVAEIARRTEGYSGADLQALVYNAQLEAIHDVLGDHGDASSGKATAGVKAKTNGVNGASSSTRDFVSFRYGEDVDEEEKQARVAAGQNRSKMLAERAAIAAKLESIRIAKKRSKMALRGGSAEELSNEEKTGNGAGGAGSKEPTIEWKHIMKSLAQTRASISPEERKRLERIYREFVVGRNGEMPSGESSMEIGGRSSLM